MTANSYDSQELRLSILGMRCAGCISAFEGALSSVSGVESVSVNFADHVQSKNRRGFWRIFNDRGAFRLAANDGDGA